MQNYIFSHEKENCRDIGMRPYNLVIISPHKKYISVIMQLFVVLLKFS